MPQTQPDLSPNGTLETPYMKAHAEWDNRIGSARVQAKNWRLACFISLSLALMAFASALHLAGKVKVIPYVIEVGQNGVVRKVGRLQAAAYDPTQATVEYFLSDWITWVRSISPDEVVVRQNWEKAYHFVTQKAANTLNAYARKVQPFSKVGQMAVTVKIDNVLVLSKRSYEVHWVEEIFDSHGSPVSTARYKGVFHFIVSLPEEEATLVHNPIGFYIDGFHWNQSRL